MLHRRADRDELGEVRAPVVAADRQAHADDAVGAELVRLLLHARHRQLAGVVHRLGQHAELHVLVPVGLLQTDVVDRAAQHEPERLKTCLLDEQELVDREVAGEEAALDVLLHALEALTPGVREPSERAGLVILRAGRVDRLGRIEIRPAGRCRPPAFGSFRRSRNPIFPPY